ncbi:MAG: translation initiation factor IF-2 N-terminal domain-containing protein, partial [Proteobacteria bacterium]|nr:translation initiation factor IF-2 N-terminal domain-containing protein [Pseudomonadota bacterium]
MAKIRVYELARDLNMTNQALLDKIRSMNIDVKSHVSSLDEETVAKIRTGSHEPKPEGIEETRVRPTIIRRRKVVVQAEAEPKLATPAPGEEPAEAETAAQAETGKMGPVEDSSSEAKSVEPETSKSAGDSQRTSLAEEAGVQPLSPEPEKPQIIKAAKQLKALKKVKKEAPAKILRLPEIQKKAEEKIEDKLPGQEAVPGKTGMPGEIV